MNEKMNLDAVTKPKRGPKPLGERALTPSERKKRSRERLAAEGDAEFMVRLHRGTLNLVDQLATANGITRSQVIAGLLDMAIAKVTLAAAEAEELQTAGAADEEVVAKLRAHLGAVPPPGLIEKYKEVGGL